MPQEGFKRKHTANLSADVVSYSRPKGKDEIGTIQLLTEYREIIARLKVGLPIFFMDLFSIYLLTILGH